MLKIAFIINGARKLTNPVNELIQQCKTHQQLDVYQFVTNESKEAIQFTKACVEKNFDVLIAVGGDGTINEVVNGILQNENKIPILGIIPMGTGNDFVRSSNLNYNHTDFINSLLERKTTTIDIAAIESNEITRYFANIADIGFGGKVVQIIDKQRKYIAGKSSYSLAILRSFLFFRKPTLSIHTENFEYSGPVMMVAICNGSVFGNGLVINPQAKINDGLLNITLLGNVSIFDYIKNVGKLKKGQKIDHPEVKYLEAKEITIKIIKGNAMAEMDGESFECGDIKIKLLPEKIKLLEY